MVNRMRRPRNYIYIYPNHQCFSGSISWLITDNYFRKSLSTLFLHFFYESYLRFSSSHLLNSQKSNFEYNGKRDFLKNYVTQGNCDSFIARSITPRPPLSQLNNAYRLIAAGKPRNNRQQVSLLIEYFASINCSTEIRRIQNIHFCYLYLLLEGITKD